MSRARPSGITIRKTADPRMMQVTFYGGTLMPEGATTTLPREEVYDWVTTWLFVEDGEYVSGQG